MLDGNKEHEIKQFKGHTRFPEAYESGFFTTVTAHSHTIFY